MPQFLILMFGGRAFGRQLEPEEVMNMVPPMMLLVALKQEKVMP
jgi:hypothetical protein